MNVKADADNVVRLKLSPFGQAMKVMNKALPEDVAFEISTHLGKLLYQIEQQQRRIRTLESLLTDAQKLRLDD